MGKPVPLHLQLALFMENTKGSLCTGGDWVWEEVALGCLKIALEIIVELCGHKSKSPHARLLYSLCCKLYVIISEWYWVWGVPRLSRDTVNSLLPQWD